VAEAAAAAGRKGRRRMGLAASGRTGRDPLLSYPCGPHG
jgi:hypothetical protein